SRRLFEVEIIARHETQRYPRHAQNGSFKCARDCAGVCRIVTEIAAVIDTGDADVWFLIFGKDPVECECNAVSGCAVDGPVTIIELADTKRTRERKTMRGATHLRGGRYDVDVTNLLQGFL